MSLSASTTAAGNEEPQKPRFSGYMAEILRSRVPPPVLKTVEFDKIEAEAREVLKERPGSYMYVYGSAGIWTTYKDNVQAFQQWKILPRMLVDANQRNIETTIFGVKIPCPVLIAPIGVQGLMHADAELATARASKNVGVPLIMSSASSRSIEEVAEENGPNNHRWYQLYWPRHDDVTLSVLSRAKKGGFTTLVVTLDTMLLGWRAHDIERAYLPFIHGFGTQVGMSDPVFMKGFGLEAMPHYHPQWPYDHTRCDELYEAGDEIVKRDAMLGRGWLQEINSGYFRTWKDLKLLRDNWDGPIVLKGIQTIADAKLAIEHGMNGIIVSNHGGRQVDGTISSLLALEKITQEPTIKEAQKSGAFTILFDSGIRTGPDIIKALALGAQAVLLGRPWMYGLAVGGQEGVEEVLRSTLCDLELSMGLAGYTSVVDIQGKWESVLHKV